MNFRHGEIFICVLDFSLHPFAEGRRRWIYVSPWNFFFLPPFFFFFFSSLSPPHPFHPRAKSRIPGQCLTATVPGRFHFPCLTDD